MEEKRFLYDHLHEPSLRELADRLNKPQQSLELISTYTGTKMKAEFEREQDSHIPIFEFEGAAIEISTGSPDNPGVHIRRRDDGATLRINRALEPWEVKKHIRRDSYYLVAKVEDSNDYVYIRSQ